MSDLEQINKMEDEANAQQTGPAVAYDDESVIWSGKPSQWVNFGTFLWWGIFSIVALVFLFVWSGSLGKSYSPFIQDVVSYSCKAIVALSVSSIVYAYLSIFYQKIEITQNKIKETKGITRIFQQDLFAEISDITDIKSPAAGLLGIVGLSNLIIETNDSDQPIIRVRAIPVSEREKLISVLQPIWRQLKIERKGYFGG